MRGLTSARARRTAGNHQDRTTDRGRGVGRTLLRLSGAHATQASVPNLSRLPVVKNSTALQNTSGAFLFLTGYSQVGGGDV